VSVTVVGGGLAGCEASLQLADVLEGTEAQIRIPKMRACGTCDGSGAAPGTSPERCGRCHGSGQVDLQQGFFRISRPCDACSGTGEIVRERCSDCRGAGRVESEQSITVRVPAGVDDGTRLRLSGEGEAGPCVLLKISWRGRGTSRRHKILPSARSRHNTKSFSSS